jgi:DNA polymerase-3 subunit gamma/tau
LIWESCIDENCRNLMKKYWGSVLKMLVDETFGIGTKVIPQKCSEIQETPKKIEEPKKNIETPIQDKIIKKAHEIFSDEITEVNVYKEK